MANNMPVPVMITGASSGIGFALAQHLLASGINHIVITGRDRHKLMQAGQRLQQAQRTCRIDELVFDQSDISSIEQVSERLKEEQKLPLTVVCNVGVNPVHNDGVKKIHSTHYQQLMNTLTTNVANSFYLLQQLLPHMREQKKGRILFVGSQAYRYGIPGQVSYNVAKSALVGLVNTLNSEYQKAGIQAQLCNVGMVNNRRTEKLRKKIAQNNQATVLSEEQVAQRLYEQLNQAKWPLQTEVDIQ